MIKNTTARPAASIRNSFGHKFSVGDVVEFKCDVEQCGTIKRIDRRPYGGFDLIVTDEFGFAGDYIGGQTVATISADEAFPLN